MNTLVSRTAARLLLLVSIVVGVGASAFAQAPTITGFSPGTIGIGMPVVITGTNFTGPVTVRFNGVQGTATLNSSTQVTATAPSPLTAGPITVTTAAGTATSATNYAVTLVPGITGFTPATGPEKRVVTITGYNFNGSGITSRTVSLNGQSVGSLSVSNSTITFAIPTGATSGPFRVQTNNGVAISATNFTVAAGVPPPNDNFVNAVNIGGSNGSITGTNTNATSEPGEPVHPGNGGGASVWFRWVAPVSGYFLFNPYDSSSQQFGIVLGIYTGSAVDSLTLVAAGQTPTNVFARYGSAAALNATAGTAYYIALDGYTGLMADFRLQWSPLNPPTISSFSPTTAGAGQSVSVTASGTGFVPGATVTLAGATVHPSRITYNSPSSLTITQIPFTATTGPLTVTTVLGTATSAASFTATAAPPPTISSFSPSSAAIGANVTITGTSLSLGPDAPATIVRFNGVAASAVSSSSSTSVSATVPPGATTGPITVETVRGTTTSVTNLTVIVPAPTISSFTPASGQAGTPITITGSNFVQVLDVQVNGVSAGYTVDSATQITATTPAGPFASGPITIVTASGTAVSSDSFTTVPAGPAITSFSPATFTPTMSVTITGVGFTGTTGVSFGGVPGAFTVDSATQITARVPFGVPSSDFIVVQTPSGPISSPLSYTLTPPAVPSIASFSPAAVGPTAFVTINGSGFSDVTSVLFNGVPATSFTVNSPTKLIATAPGATLTAGAITVTTSIGSATSPTNYTVSLAPVITGISPSSGPVNRIITVQGFNFSGTGISNQVLKVNGTSIGSFSRSSTTYTFAVPAGATTGPITLQTSQGLATSPIAFVVTNLPPPANDNFANAQVITGSSGIFNGNNVNATKEPGEPDHADNPGGASVWFTWTAPSSGLYLFNPSNSASSQFGITQSIYTGSAVNALTRVASGLTPTNVFARFGSAAVLDAVSGTTYHIALDGYNGVMADYRLSWAPLTPPTISSFTPSGAIEGQTINVNISGTQFTPGAAVTIGGVPVDPSRLNYQSSTLITITQIPLGAVTGPITVTTPAGTATSAAPFIVTPLAPTITLVSPNIGAAGDSVTISGTNLATTSSVLFNGLPATFTVLNGTSLTAVVPNGASTGNVTVVTQGGSASSPTPFAVIVPPSITADPLPQTATVGDTVSFEVTIATNGPPAYQWLKDDVAVAGNPSATTGRLTLTGITTADAGAYRCRVSNAAGSVLSAPALLTVNKAPATIALSGLSTTYNGSPQSVGTTTTPSGLAVVVTYDGTPAAPTNAGTYSVVATIVDANYAGSASGTQTIARAPAAIALSGLSTTYNGSPQSVGTTTTPSGLAVVVTYDGSPAAPTNAGTYSVVATIVDANYAGSASGTQTIARAPAAITLAGLAQTYDGAPKPVTATPNPANLAVTIDYNGTPNAPTYPGAYPVTATIADPNYTGSAAGVLTIGTTALVRRAPSLDGGLDGSIQVLNPESIRLNSLSWVSGDLLVPGTPNVQQNGHPAYAGTLDATGGAAPSSHTITLNGSAVLRHVVRRVDPRAMPEVETPPLPAGTRSVSINSAGDTAGDFTTVRNLTLAGNAGDLSVPPGTYGDFTVNGNSGLVLGVAGSEQPTVYNLQRLVLNSNGQLQLVGPVILTVAESVTVNGAIGSAGQPHWLTLRIADGNLTLNGSAHLAGDVIVPNGTVTIQSATLTGSVTADDLTINGSGVLQNP